MKSALLVMLLAAAASAAVVSNEVPDVVEVPDVDEVVDVDEFSEDFVTDMDDLTDEVAEPAQFLVNTRRNLNQGNIVSGDTRVFNREYRVNGTAGIAKVRNVLVNAKRPINAIRVNRVGDTQNASPSIVAGGIGKYFVIIRIRSARGSGYHYRVEVYVR